MKYKKFLFGTAMCLAVLTLSACGGGKASSNKANKEDIKVNATGMPIVDKKLEMTLMAPGTGLAEWKDMPTLNEYAKETNIYFKYTTPPLSDFSTKLNLAFASGDLPDIIYGAGSSNLTRAMEIDYGTQGLLLPLEDLIPKYAPNLNKVLEDDPEIKKSITAPDGHIYTLPTISAQDTSIWPRGPMWYNGAWMKKLGVTEVPKTTDEFYKLLIRFRDEDPNGTGKKDTIPLTDVKMESTRPWLLSAFGITTQGIEEIDGKIVYTPTTENYRAYLEYMHKLYDEKLLDQEVFSQADEQKKAKGNDNRLGVFPDYFSFFTTGQTEEEAIENPMFGPLTSEYSKEPIFPGSQKIQTGTFAITKENPSPEASIRWVDYFYSEEGYTFLNQGPEGNLWEYADLDGKKVKVFAKGIDTNNAEDERGKITPAYGITVPAYEVTIPNLKKDTTDPEFSDFSKFIKEETEEKIEPYAKVPFPIVYLTKEENDKIGAISTDLRTYVEEMEAKFITGVEKIDQANWDKYVKTIDSMGVKEYVKVYQEAYDRWKKS